ncbi:MAG: M48 family metalloprotease [Gaiellaceae bacterium]
MTANSRRLLGLLVFGVLAGGWFYAAYALWQTSVPSNLKLPKIDLTALFGAADLHQAQHFTLISDLFGLCGLLLPLLVLAVYSKYGHRFMGESAAGPIGTGMLLAMLGLALVWISMAAPGLAQLWWYRKHGIVSTSYAGWILGSWFGLIPTFEQICLTILIVMGFARFLGNRWWIAAAPVFVGVMTLFVFLAPYEIPLKSLQGHPQLVAAEGRIAAREGVAKIPMRVENVGTMTTAPNAFATGLGPSRRIVLWDTILDGRFSEPQLEVVVAHELGHQKHNHLWKFIGWYGLFVFPIAYLIARWTRRRGGMAVPLAVPLFLFLWFALQTAIIPLNNAFSRRLEAEADWTALQATRDPAAADGLFKNLVEATSEDPNPPLWDQIVFGNHPTAEQRLAMVKAWQARNGG